MDFVKIKGMSHLLTKRMADCTEEEKAYKRSYTKYIKGRYLAKQNKDEFSLKTKLYNQKYYEQHKDDLRTRSRENSRKKRDIMYETIN